MVTVSDGVSPNLVPWLVNVADELIQAAKDVKPGDGSYDSKYATMRSPEITGNVKLGYKYVEFGVEVFEYQYDGMVVVLDLEGGTVRLEDNGMPVGASLMLRTGPLVV